MHSASRLAMAIVGDGNPTAQLNPAFHRSGCFETVCAALRGTDLVANKDTNSVVSALIKQSQRLPRELYKSLTWDRHSQRM